MGFATTITIYKSTVMTAMTTSLYFSLSQFLIPPGAPNHYFKSTSQTSWVQILSQMCLMHEILCKATKTFGVTGLNNIDGCQLV